MMDEREKDDLRRQFELLLEKVEEGRVTTAAGLYYFIKNFGTMPSAYIDGAHMTAASLTPQMRAEMMNAKAVVLTTPETVQLTPIKLPPQEVVYTQSELEERLAYWQMRLRLQDWHIQIKIVRMSEMNGSIGRVLPLLEKKIASIRIADHADYPPDSITPNDMENTLVHELLHLHFYPLTKDKDFVLEEEQAIESIVSGLINLERKM